MDLAVQLSANVFNKTLLNATDATEPVCVNLVTRAGHAVKVSWFIAAYGISKKEQKNPKQIQT